MTHDQAVHARRLVTKLAERTEIHALDGGGSEITVHWRAGGQRLFCEFADLCHHIGLAPSTRKGNEP